jgi:hypothetical protein
VLYVGSNAFQWLGTGAGVQGIADFDATGTMGGTSLAYSTIDGEGLVESQPPYEMLD